MLNIRYKEKANAWPGFVDLFSNLVIILIFLLIVFVFLWMTTSIFNKDSGVRTVNQLRQENASQAALIQQMENDETEATRDEIWSKDSNIADLNNAITDLSTAYEQKLQTLEKQTDVLQKQIQELQTNRDITTKYETKINDLEAQISRQKDEREQLIAQIDDLQKKLDAQAQVQLAVSTAEMQQLQNDLANARAELEQNMAQAQAELAASRAEYISLSEHFNKALADKVAELNEMTKYQSDFYRAIKEALGNRTVVRPDGDRFIVSSDILFPSGKYTLSADGKKQLKAIANVIQDFESKIDPNVKWIIRVDGHTDSKPVLAGTKGYKNNLQLSILRANAVVEELAKNGVSRRRLVPSGFGDLHPIELGQDTQSLQKNRRIELQLTNK